MVDFTHLDLPYGLFITGHAAIGNAGNALFRRSIMGTEHNRSLFTEYFRTPLTPVLRTDVFATIP